MTLNKKMIIHYSDIGTPFLIIYKYENKVLSEKKEIILDSFLFDEGKIINIEKIASMISEVVEPVNFDLVVSLKETFKNTISLPKMTKYKSIKLKNNELKSRFENYNNNYITFKYQNQHSLGMAYYTYFVPKSIIDSFKALAKVLKVRFENIALYGDFLFNNINYNENYFAIFKNVDTITLLNVIDNRINTIYEFSYLNKDNLLNNIISVISKHEFELEKRKLSSYISNTSIGLIDIGLDIAIDLAKTNIKKKTIEVDYKEYHFKGKNV